MRAALLLGVLLAAPAAAQHIDVPRTLGPAEGREALGRSLDWLVTNQNEDGSWACGVLDGLLELGFSIESFYAWQVASNALACLALLDAPETPAPRVPRGPAPHGVLRVEVLDADLGSLPGFSAGDCDPVTGDDTRRIVSWRGRRDLKALAGKTVRLRFHLRNAALYSFQFTTEGAADDSVHLGCPGCRGLPGRPAANR